MQSVALIIASPLTGRLSDRLRRRKIFVMAAAVIYAAALFVIASASGIGGYLFGMALGGLGFGMYMAVDLALVVDVLPDTGSAAKDLGVINIAGALPFALAPALAPAVLEHQRGQLLRPVPRGRYLRAPWSPRRCPDQTCPVDGPVNNRRTQLEHLARFVARLGRSRRWLPQSSRPVS